MKQTRRGFMGSAAAATLISACATTPIGKASNPDLEIFDAEAHSLLDVSARLEVLASGYTWSEGPVWDRARNSLYFTDVPENIAWKWSEASGATEFLAPSGIAREQATGFREPGANGLAISQDGSLLICNHGRRAVERMDFETGHRKIIAATFNGKKFNSPNDVVEAPDGSLFFTDPPYGLEGLNASPLKQMAVNGVYCRSPEGEIARIVDDMTFPNGAALSPDEGWLYVSQSDPDAPLIRRFKLEAGAIAQQDGDDIWFDARNFMHPVGGLPDGMAVTVEGHVLLAGPGGVLVIDRDGQCLGRVFTGRASANCAFGEDGRTLFITTGDRLVSVRCRRAGLGWVSFFSFLAPGRVAVSLGGFGALPLVSRLVSRLVSVRCVEFEGVGAPTGLMSM